MKAIFSEKIECDRLKPLTISAVCEMLTGISYGYSLMVLNFFIRDRPVMVWIPLVDLAAEHIDFKWETSVIFGTCLSNPMTSVPVPWRRVYSF